MTELKQRMDALADRAAGEPVGLAGLHEARKRKARRQRLGAGLVALGVAVAGTFTAMTAFRDRVDDPTVPVEQAWAAPEVLTVWPENPVRGESPEDVQAAVDAGDESLAWRLDPREVAERFVRMVLAWEGADVQDYDGPALSGSRILILHPKCAEGVLCVREPLFVELSQPTHVGEGGIWSIASVSSDPLGVDVEPTDPASPLAFGSAVHVTADIADDTSAHAGIVVANGCEQAFELETSIPSSTSLVVPAAENLDPSCGRIGAGYVFIYAMDDTTEPTGDPLLEAAAIESPWLTIVPVYAEMQPGETATASPSPVRDVLGITCSTDGTLSLSSTVVAATASGVVVSTGYEYPYDVRFDKDERYGAGDYATLTLDLPPGQHEVQCIRSEGEVVSDPVAFEVVDPNGYWVDPELDCDFVKSVALDSGPVVIQGDPSDELLASADAVFRHEKMGGISADGSVGFGGYPESRGSRSVVFVDLEGSVLGRMGFTQRGQDWYPDHVDTCDGSVIF